CALDVLPVAPPSKPKPMAMTFDFFRDFGGSGEIAEPKGQWNFQARARVARLRSCRRHFFPSCGDRFTQQPTNPLELVPWEKHIGLLCLRIDDVDRLPPGFAGFERAPLFLDRKSTRLNSSHDQISYAVFCLKKKTC